MFWIGFVICAAIAAGVFVLLTKSSFKITWWQWLLAALAVLAFFAAVQHMFGSFAENEVKSAWIGFAIFGVIGVILAALTCTFVLRNNK